MKTKGKRKIAVCTEFKAGQYAIVFPLNGLNMEEIFETGSLVSVDINLKDEEVKISKIDGGDTLDD